MAQRHEIKSCLWSPKPNKNDKSLNQSLGYYKNKISLLRPRKGGHGSALSELGQAQINLPKLKTGSKPPQLTIQPEERRRTGGTALSVNSPKKSLSPKAKDAVLQNADL